MDIKLKTTATINEISALKIVNKEATMTSSPKDIDLSENTTTQGAFGKFVSKEFACDVFKSYKQTIQTAPSSPFGKDVERVFFSRELIDLILSQSGCEGISVYYVYPPTVEQINDMVLNNATIKESDIKRHLSVLILGNDGNGKPLVDIENPTQGSNSIIAEVGAPPPYNKTLRVSDEVRSAEKSVKSTMENRTTGIDYLSL